MICDCGHEVDVPVQGPTGYALTKDGQTVCYSCAEKNEKEDFLQASKYPAYVSKKDDHFVITTWTGGLLAQVKSMRQTKIRGRDSRWLYSIRAVDETGGQWTGRGGGEGLYINLRRIKARA